MDQELKENLPIFSVLALGGILILAMSGVIIWQQFRVVSSDVQKIEQPEKTEQKVDAGIVGTWIGQPAMLYFFGEIRFKYVFGQDGSYKWFLMSPTGTQEVLYSYGEYKVTKMQGTKGEIDIIALFNERFHQADGSYTALTPLDATGQTGVLNLLELTQERLCIFGDVAVPDPSMLSKDLWQCLNRAKAEDVSTSSIIPLVSQQAPINPPEPAVSNAKPQSLLVGRWHGGFMTLVYTADGKYQGYNYTQANPPNLLDQSGLYSYDESTKTISITKLLNHDTSGNSRNDVPGPDTKIQVRRLDNAKLCYVGVEDYQCLTRE